MTKTYDIEMSVPLGIRHGVMSLSEQKGTVNGTFEIMGNTTTFTGTLENNEICISGKLDISVRKIAYQGVGTIEDEEIYMQLKNEKSVYRVKGFLRK